MHFEVKSGRVLLTAGALAVVFAMGGCASKPDPNDEAAVQAYNEANDPLEPMNRYFFEVNHFLDEVIVKPFAGPSIHGSYIGTMKWIGWTSGTAKPGRERQKRWV